MKKVIREDFVFTDHTKTNLKANLVDLVDAFDESILYA